MLIPFKKSLLCGTLAVLLSLGSFPSVASQAASHDEPLPLEQIQQFTDVYGAIKSFYVDPTQDKALLENALSGLLSGLDPHSAYLDEKAFADLQEGTQGEFGGLGLEVTMDDAGVLVIAPIDDTPAARAGILAGDIIIKLNNQATRSLTLSENVQLMRGKPKTKIDLVIARKGVDKPLNFTLVRDTIKVESVKMKKLDNHLGYIRIAQFQEHTANDLAQALLQLHKSKNLNGLVLDLRNDPGGLLNAAVGVVTAFVGPDKVVVSTRGQAPDSERIFQTRPSDYLNYRQKRSDDKLAKLPQLTQTVPMVVLINSASASASEIVAGALQDHARATIMGHQSFGKGSVQTILPLRPSKGSEPKTGIKLTTARYYTPSGRSIQATGITPDIEVADTKDGNYLSFNIREADLAGHLSSEKDGKAQESKSVDSGDENAEQPKQRYRFGDNNDFQLQQAINHLLGKPVVADKKKKHS